MLLIQLLFQIFMSYINYVMAKIISRNLMIELIRFSFPTVSGKAYSPFPISWGLGSIYSAYHARL